MAKGESGRIVLEVDPELKKKLYSILAFEQVTLKDWFIQNAERHIKDRSTEILKIIEQDQNEV